MAAVGEQFGDLGNPPDVLLPILLAEAEVLVQACADVVAVQSVRRDACWTQQNDTSVFFGICRNEEIRLFAGTVLVASDLVSRIGLRESVLKMWHSIFAVGILTPD